MPGTMDQGLGNRDKPPETRDQETTMDQVTRDRELGLMMMDKCPGIQIRDKGTGGAGTWDNGSGTREQPGIETKDDQGRETRDREQGPGHGPRIRTKDQGR